MANVYDFTGACMDKAELGNKGKNLVAMTRLGLPVPPGFVITVNAFKRWQENAVIPEPDILQALAALESKMGKKMGKKMGQGLQVSVRSSAAASMPGMMDTISRVALYTG
jgi:pyruvate,orthophosphate dikinase